MHRLDFIEQALESIRPALDAQKIWGAISASQILHIANPLEFTTYESLDNEQSPQSGMTLIIDIEGGYTISSMLRVDETGLASRLGDRLGFVPRLIQFSWVFDGQSIGTADVAICLGHHSFQETWETSQIALCSLTGSPIQPHVSQWLLSSSLASKIGFFKAVQALARRKMLLHASVGSRVSTISPIQSLYSHGLQ
jgi:hypothetical protein